MSLSSALRDAPRVRGQWHYTLPTSIWNGLVREIDPSQFETDEFNFARILAVEAESVPGCVGFRDGIPIIDELLRPIPRLDMSSTMVSDYFREFQAAGFRADGIDAVIRHRSELFHGPRRGYLGWLWTNPAFLSEWRTLSGEMNIADAHVHPPIPLSSGAIKSLKSESDVRRASRDDPVSEAVRAFCHRWRLSQIVGPATVYPMGTQFPAALVGDLSGAQTTGSFLYIPDIAPLPNRDELRQMLEETVRQTAAHNPHLDEWMNLVRADTQGKNAIAKYAEWYLLQHYLRVLYSRQHAALGRSLGSITGVLSTELNLSLDTIRRYLREIKGRLGDNWYLPSDPATTS